MDEAIRQKILELLRGHRIMTVAMLRRDGWPQATTVGYVSDGLALYFLCSPQSQKAEEVRVFRLTPTVISALDYTKGFGHAELVTL